MEQLPINCLVITSSVEANLYRARVTAILKHACFKSGSIDNDIGRKLLSLIDILDTNAYPKYFSFDILELVNWMEEKCEKYKESQ